MRDHGPHRIPTTVLGRTRLPVSLDASETGFKDRQKENRQKRAREKLIRQKIESLKDLKVPGDGIVRAVVSIAVKKPRKHPLIADFRKVFRKYCELWMGFSSRRVEQACLYIMLNRKLAARKRKARADAEEAIRQHISHPDACRVHLAMILKPLDRKNVETMMTVLFKEIHEEILMKADTGERIDCEAGQSPLYEPRRSFIGSDVGRPCFFIVTRARGGLKVVTLVSESEFRRRSRRNWQDRQRRREKTRFWQPRRRDTLH